MSGIELVIEEKKEDTIDRQKVKILNRQMQ